MNPRLAHDNKQAEDLSGTPLSSAKNPFDFILESCNDNSIQIQRLYEDHRETRNDRYKNQILGPEFPGWSADSILQKLIHPERHPAYVDPRHCLVFWARPPDHLRVLVDLLQQKLRKLEPELWLMPLDCLHMTALEVAHSLAESEIEHLVQILQPGLSEITDFTFNHRARLVKPLLSYDNQAIALSLLPASENDIRDDSAAITASYTYHHLRRDLYNLCTSAGVDVGSRYVAPSAHLTIARFVTTGTSDEGDKHQLSSVAGMARWVAELDDINTWLRKEYWPKPGSTASIEGEWVVGEGKGLECRAGTLWYGGGRSICVGKGFKMSPTSG